MKNENLLKKVSALGYPLFEKEEGSDANLTLAEVVKSRDLRLWEGFPLMLVNASKAGSFDYKKARALLKQESQKRCFDELLSLSLALYEALGMKFSWVGRLPKDDTRYGLFLEKLKKGKEVKVCAVSLSPERLKNAFNNYFKEEERGLSEFVAMKEDFGVEYALSQVFSPKQKELFFKKLKGEKLSKTKREYYSRAVKKKVMALANPELHRLARNSIAIS